VNHDRAAAIENTVKRYRSIRGGNVQKRLCRVPAGWTLAGNLLIYGPILHLPGIIRALVLVHWTKFPAGQEYLARVGNFYPRAANYSSAQGCALPDWFPETTRSVRCDKCTRKDDDIS